MSISWLDVMISRDDFIREHPRAVRAFIQGWLDGTKLANQDSMRVATLLMDNEPLYRDLGLEHTLNDLATVRWADLEDNAQMFGLRGGEAIFDQIFDRAGRVWVKRGYIKERVAADLAKDDQFLRAIYAEVSSNQKIK